MSLKIDGGWALASGKPLPPGLRAKSNGKFKDRGKVLAKGRGKHNR
jgi:hypothetical protein